MSKRKSANITTTTTRLSIPPANTTLILPLLDTTAEAMMSSASTASNTSTTADTNGTPAAINGTGSSSNHKKGGRIAGSCNYTAAQVDALSSNVHLLNPVTSADWLRVAEAYRNATGDDRDSYALKLKWRKISETNRLAATLNAGAADTDDGELMDVDDKGEAANTSTPSTSSTRKYRPRKSAVKPDATPTTAVEASESLEPITPAKRPHEELNNDTVDNAAIAVEIVSLRASIHELTRTQRTQFKLLSDKIEAQTHKITAILNTVGDLFSHQSNMEKALHIVPPNNNTNINTSSSS